MSMTGPFRPLIYTDGQLPIADYGLIGDGATAALIGRDGGVGWLCAPRFDSPPLLCPLLDPERGGSFRVAPVGCREGRQAYLGDSAVLVTELRGEGGRLRLTDLLPVAEGSELRPGTRAARGGLLRRLEAVGGPVAVELSLHLRAPPAGPWRWQAPGAPVALHADGELDPAADRLLLHPERPLHLYLEWCGNGAPADYEALLAATLNAWQRWLRHYHYEGHAPAAVRRSAITLKLLDFLENGALLAAPTSSLPECIGGLRNWDYRYAWVRDTAFAVYALRRLGMRAEGKAFLDWMVREVPVNGRPHVAYDIDGGTPHPERQDPELRGYRGSAPVRWGNDAAYQRQHDVFGELVDCAYQLEAGGGTIDESLWRRLCHFVRTAAREWQTPDHGIWEVRTAGAPFTYSAGLCQVALDRGARLAARRGLDAHALRWRQLAARIRDTLLERAWNPKRRALCGYLGGDGLDASVLALPLRRVVPANHPRMRATVEAIAAELGAGDGLLYRYHPDQVPDGLPGREGAFLICSFWWVENLAEQGRVEEAAALFDRLVARCNPLGLLPEQIDPASGAFLGNFPQGLSHVGLIAAAVKIGRFGGNGASSGQTTID